MKRTKLSRRIATIIAIVAAICIAIIFFLSDANMTNAISESATNNMVTSLDAKVQIIDEYISNAESVLYLFSKSEELKSFLKDPSDTELQKKAQDYTSAFYEGISNWEGIYLDTWDTVVITHSNPDAVGLVTREGDGVSQLQDSIMSANGGVYNLGILQSPASGQQVISMYAPILDNGTPIGFVGGATLAQGLKDLLDATVAVGLENATYSIIDINKGTYIFDSDETLISTEVSDPMLLNTLEQAAAGTLDGTINYKDDTGEAYSAVYHVIDKRGWLVIQKDKDSEIFHDVRQSRNVLCVVCLLGLAMIILFSLIAIRDRKSVV